MVFPGLRGAPEAAIASFLGEAQRQLRPYDVFLGASVFNFGSGPVQKRKNVEAFTMTFDTGQAPMVGQQVTIGPATVNDTDVLGRIDLMIARDDATRCDLTVKGSIAGVPRGWVYVGGNTFQPDRNTEGVITKTNLKNLAATAGQELTYTCVPLGSGTRIGVDRDLILQRFVSQMPVRFEPAKGPAALHGVVIVVDPESGRASDIRRLRVPA